MKLLKFCIFVATLGLAQFASADGELMNVAMARDEYVTCSSIDYQPATCYYNNRWGYVQLVERHSRPTSKGGSCQGEWSAQDGMIQVWSGCRATFLISDRGGPNPPPPRPNPPPRPPPGPGPGGRSEIVRCESWNNQPNTCYLRGRFPRYARVLNKYSRDKSDGTGRCDERRDWVLRNRAIDVYNGCRADFEVYY